MGVIVCSDSSFDFSTDIMIIGAGACGLTAALAARDGGAEVLVLERDSTPLGTTAMSTGLIPAAGTAEQAERGINDDAALFAKDILGKAKTTENAGLVEHLAAQSSETVAWLRDSHNVPLTLLDGFVYPGHSVMRMYGSPNRTGSELMAALESATSDAGADILTDALVTDLLVDDAQTVLGVRLTRPDGSTEEIGCGALILACCGFAGSPDMVANYIPEIASGVFHGHPGNKGDAISWGEALGASLKFMDAYQGHGGLAAGHGIPILWPLIMEGGFQVNLEGCRFSDESLGYSEQAVKVLEQPKGVAYSIFDERLHQLMEQFDDYQDALRAGAIIRAESIDELAAKTNLPSASLLETFSNERAIKAGERSCDFGRDFNGKDALEAPFYAAKVTGALFHTQGGLEVNEDAQVIRKAGGLFPNLFAGGGAAAGISGHGAGGYMAGNGLLTATTFGKLAGRAAARLS